MPNNFRKSAANNGYFISKDGDNGTAVQYTGANETAARDSPRNTPFTTKQGTVKHIIGAGHYQMGASIEPQNLEADGLVVLDGDGVSSMLANYSDTTSETQFRNILIRGFTNFMVSFFRSQIYFENCILQNIKSTKAFGANGNASFVNCLVFSDGSALDFLIYTATSGTIGSQSKVISNTTFYNMKVTSTLSNSLGMVINNCAFINESGNCIEVNNFIDIITNSGFHGPIKVGATTYSSFSDPQLAIDFPDFVDPANGNFEITQDLDDCFNNRLKNDFTLKASSQLIKEDRTVGGTNFAFSKYIDVDEVLSSPGLTVSPSTSATGFLFREVKAGESNVTLTSDAFLLDPVNSSIVIMDKLNLLNELNFDTDLAADEPKNQNVPSTENFAAGTAGGNPKRLTFEFRTSRNEPTNKPSDASDWDNGFNGITAGDWIKHEFNNEKVVVDSLGKGKGDDDYDGSLDQLEFVAVWCQIRITLRRDHDL